MGAKLKFEWENTTMEALKQSSKRNEIIDKALKKGIVPIHDQIVKNLKGHRSKKSHPHLQDNIPINEIETKGAYHAITTGFEKSDNSDFFYAKMLEWGTSKMKAYPFMQPAYNSKVKKSLEVMQESVKEDLGL